MGMERSLLRATDAVRTVAGESTPAIPNHAAAMSSVDGGDGGETQDLSASDTTERTVSVKTATGRLAKFEGPLRARPTMRPSASQMTADVLDPPQSTHRKSDMIDGEERRRGAQRSPSPPPRRRNPSKIRLDLQSVMSRSVTRGKGSRFQYPQRRNPVATVTELTCRMRHERSANYLSGPLVTISKLNFLKRCMLLLPNTCFDICKAFSSSVERLASTSQNLMPIQSTFDQFSTLHSLHAPSIRIMTVSR